MSNQGPSGYDPLDEDYRDQLVAIGKGAASLIPLVGGPLSESLLVLVGLFASALL